MNSTADNITYIKTILKFKNTVLITVCKFSIN